MCGCLTLLCVRAVGWLGVATLACECSRCVGGEVVVCLSLSIPLARAGGGCLCSSAWVFGLLSHRGCSLGSGACRKTPLIDQQHTIKKIQHMSPVLGFVCLVFDFPGASAPHLPMRSQLCVPLLSPHPTHPPRPLPAPRRRGAPPSLMPRWSG